MKRRRGRSAKAPRGKQVELVRASPWVPAADIVETDDEYVVVIDIAGADAGDLDVIYEAGALTVAGVRHAQPDSPRRPVAEEIRFGRFERQVSLPGPVDAAGLRARYDRGLLRVTLRKAREPRVRIVRE